MPSPQITADLAPSFVRTLVPFIVGALGSRYGLDSDDPTTSLLAQVVIGYVYYVIVRLLELRAPQLGYLLGVNKAPVYTTPRVPSASVTTASGVGEDHPER